MTSLSNYEMQVLMVDTSREILRLGCRARQSLRISQAVVFFLIIVVAGIEKWLHILRQRERAMSDALNTLIGKKRSQLITLKCPRFTIKVIQICTVESVFMMRTHNLVEHRASRVNVFFLTFALDAAHVTLPMRRGPLRG